MHSFTCQPDCFKGLRRKVLVILCGVFLTIAAGAEQVAHLRVEEISSLDFGESPQGDLPRRILPTDGALGGAATFRVLGPAYRSYTILLPHAAVLAAGSGASSIILDQFSSIPSPGPNGQLNAAGMQMLFVGARRGAISTMQPRGHYSGRYFMQIIY